MEAMRIGILGCGGIAAKMAATLVAMPQTQVRLVAVASRSEEKARAFAARFDVPTAYGDYCGLYDDPEVDLIYIATPHNFHFSQTMAALRAGKHVLCEKPLAVNAAQGAQMVALAKQTGRFLLEAVWTRFQPLAKTALDWLAAGAVGKPLSLEARFGCRSVGVPRIREPELAGGALLDLGIYTLTAASLLFGDEGRLYATHAALSDAGIDLRSESLYLYPDGKTAHLVSAVDCPMERRVTVYGTDARLEISGISRWDALTLYAGDDSVLRHEDAPDGISGYEYEVLSACAAIRAGKIECAELPHALSLQILRQMDELRAAWGMRYPFETEPDVSV